MQFVQPEGSLLCSQETITGPCPEPADNPSFCLKYILILSYDARLYLSIGLLSRIMYEYEPLLTQYMSHAFLPSHPF